MRHTEDVLLVLVLSSIGYRTLDCSALKKFFERSSFSNGIERV